MKGFAAAALAAMATGATAINHRHAHQLFKRGEAEMCTPGCTTIYTTVTGEPTLCPPPPPATTSVKPTTTVTPTPSTTETPKPTTPTTTETPKLPVPTPEPITCPTPGTYTFTATTVTLSETTTVCVGTSTHVPSGTHTVGGVTTIVEEATTVTCPVATHTTQPDGKVIETIIETEYVCPTAGTYTIAPITTTVTEECDIEYPVPTSYNPGTYTAPEQVITVTDTNFVTVCPYTSSEAPKPTSHPPPPPKTTAEAPKPKPTTPKEETSPSPKPEKPSNGGGHFDGSFGSSGDHYGVTYTPYDEQTGDCKPSWQVEKDLAEIKNDGFEVVRVYSTDCDTLPSVGAACKKHGLKMLVGIFVKETGCSAQTPEIKEQIDAISEWAQWDLVKLVIVGNESVMNGFCTPSELASLIKTVRSSFSAYTGPYTVAETLAQWLDPSTSGALCDAVDFTGANVHPFFNAENFASMAGKFVKSQLDILDSICSGKKAVNLECGWPLEGNCMGSACPGADAQAEALDSIRKECGDRSVFFSYTSDSWKEPGPQNVEQHWGCKDYFSLF